MLIACKFDVIFTRPATEPNLLAAAMLQRKRLKFSYTAGSSAMPLPTRYYTASRSGRTGALAKKASIDPSELTGHFWGLCDGGLLEGYGCLGEDTAIERGTSTKHD